MRLSLLHLAGLYGVIFSLGFAVEPGPASTPTTPAAVQATPTAVQPGPVVVESLSPLRWERRGAVQFADFGSTYYGTLEFVLTATPRVPATLTVRLGEKLGGDGAIERHPQGSINTVEVPVSLEPGRTQYRVQLPTKKRHLWKEAVRAPAVLGEITPFRYAEIEGLDQALSAAQVHQLCVHAPFNETAARFRSSDETLNAVWELCRHTIKASSAFGLYVDGERERIAYEADAYINQLSHYAFDLDPRLARATFEQLLAHPTWPTEWSLHMPLIAAADYRATGDACLAAAHWEPLCAKLLSNKARGDGLLQADAIVDWPACERDHYNEDKPARDTREVGPEINTVVNAFHYRALQDMALLARALGKTAEAQRFDLEAARVREAFNSVFFDPLQGLYRDGEGSAHASLHANFFALAFDLVPAERRYKVLDFVQSKGMGCSVYGAQYLLEALFGNGRDEAAVSLLCSRGLRSWWHMIELGSTNTLEAWDASIKPNLTWNHAWGTAPANLISRYVLGVRPLSPGYAEILVAPQLGGLNWVEGQVPTAKGPVQVAVHRGRVWRLDLSLPAGVRACVRVPRLSEGQLLVDAQPVTTRLEGNFFLVDVQDGGTHTLESR